jgi:glutathione synthase/RimK-type ligase-like ATP-grasp enzyme
MKDFIVLVDQKKDWQAYYPSEHLIQSKDYLFDLYWGGDSKRTTRVINLCKSYKYLSIGYYSSLLAESRGHRVIPSIKTLNDLSKKRLYLYNLEEVQELLDTASQRFTSNTTGLKSFAFRTYFGQSKDPLFRELSQQIFDQFPCPILEVRLTQKNGWKIESIIPISFTDLHENEEGFFGESLEAFSTKIWRLPNKGSQYEFDLAILVDPQEELPPSDETALKNFERVFKSLGIYTERVNRRDMTRINEFDGLFIRETTTIKNHTYAFSLRAQQEGLIVIDDPESILKCTNKVFMYNLMERNGIAQLPSRFVSDSQEETLTELEKSFSFPIVLKIPDGSFSIGVKKVSDRDELKLVLDDFLKKSALVLVQKFLPTDFDWRIGVLRGEALYACRYFMSRGHWQIYDHNKTDGDVSGESETLPLDEVPKEIVDTAVKVCQLIGNGLYGVDLKVINGVPMVVEVNDNPSIDASVEDLVLGDELYKKIGEAFLYQFKQDYKS